MNPDSLAIDRARTVNGATGRRMIGAAGAPAAIAALRRRLMPVLPPGRLHPAAADADSRLFLWTATQDGLAPRWSVAPDGSLAVVDGTVWFVRGQGGAPPPDPAGAVLDLVRAGGGTALERISMDAAVAVWDARSGTLVLGRDRRGAMPLYHAEIDGAVLWAADLPSLLDAGVARAVDEIAVDNVLANGFVPAPLTMVKAIRKLTAGCAATVCDGRIAITRFDPAPPREVADLDAAATTAALGERLAVASARRAPPDEPVGVLLSSGVDSKLILGALMRVPGRDPATVHTFTYRYAGYEGGWNEGAPAREAAAYFGAVHREIEFGPAFVADNFDRMLWAYGDPFTYGMHSFLLDPILEAGVRRVFTGAGADGWYQGRRERRAKQIRDASPLAVAALSATTAAAGAVASLLSPLPRLNRYAEGLAWRLDEYDWLAGTGIPWRSGASILPARHRRRLYRDPTLAARGGAVGAALFADAAAPVAGYRDEVRFPFVHLRYFVAEAAHQWYAACTRASGLRFEHPFFDDDMIDLLFSLPRPSADKRDLRRLAETMMPPEMANVPKVAQTAPIRQWFRGPLRDFLCDGLARERLLRHGLFDPRGVERLLGQHLRGEMNHEWRLWGVLAVTRWHELVLDGRR